MTDILKHCYVDVHCGQCGEFAVRADVIAESQRLLARGCPGSTYECPPALLATLLEPTALASLERAWSALEGGAHAPAEHVQLGDSLRIHLRRRTEREQRGTARPDDLRPDDAHLEAANSGTARLDTSRWDTARLDISRWDTARWDDDGGYVPPPES